MALVDHERLTGATFGNDGNEAEGCLESMSLGQVPAPIAQAAALGGITKGASQAAGLLIFLKAGSDSKLHCYRFISGRQSLEG